MAQSSSDHNPASSDHNPILPRRKDSQLNLAAMDSNVDDCASVSTPVTISITSLHASPIEPLRNSDFPHLLVHDTQSRRSLPSPGQSFNEASAVGVTKAGVEAFLHEYYEDYGSIGRNNNSGWELFFSKYFSPEFQMVRSSGNPISRDSLLQMYLYDLKIIKVALVSVDSITIMNGQASAIALFTADQIYTYRGMPNEDRTVISCIIEQRGGQLQIVHEHRTAGRTIPRETRWSTEE